MVNVLSEMVWEGVDDVTIQIRGPSEEEYKSFDQYLFCINVEGSTHEIPYTSILKLLAAAGLVRLATAPAFPIEGE